MKKDFRIEITKEYTEFEGTRLDLLTGLLFYIKALIKEGIKEEYIREAINVAFNETRVKTILDDDNMKIEKLDLKGLSREEAEKILDKNILDKLFD